MPENKNTTVRLNPQQWLCLGVFIFAVIQFIFVWNGGRNGVFNSPDASANYHFAFRLFSGQSLPIPMTSPSSAATEFLSTRSTRVVEGRLIPVSFLGLIVLYGFISKIIFINVLAYLTILFAAVCVYFFYKLSEYFFDQKIALISSLLLLVHPAWWYFTHESLFPNVLFLSLFIAAYYYFVRAFSAGNERVHALLAGILLVLALFVRVSEVIWVVPLCLVSLFFLKKTIQKKQLVFFLFSTLVIGMGCALIYEFLYGRLLLGYKIIPSQSDALPLFNYLLPFGFHPRLIILHAVQYGAVLLWPFSLLTILGCVLIARGLPSRPLHQLYLALIVTTGGILMFYFGSWQIIDNPFPSQISLSSSYARYLLPFYVLSLPLAALSLTKLGRLLGKKSRVFNIAVSVAFICFSFSLVFADPVAGFFAERRILKQYDQTATWIVNHTPHDAIMVTAKGDKYIWPHRHVMTMYSTPQAVDALYFFLHDDHRQLFFVSVTLSGEQELQQEERWSAQGLELSEPLYTNHDVSIYQIYEHNEAS